MPKLRIEWNTCPSELCPGLRELITHRPTAFSNAPSARTIRFVNDTSPSRPGFSINHQHNSATVRYSRLCDAFRALGHLLGQAHANATPRNVTQSCQFDLLGVKLDCARNGVPTLDTLQSLFQHMALLGFNCFSPYLEDNYEIPGEPFFGYLRGRYSQKDLKTLDDYAFALGIEVFGHVRTLGHAEQILQWPVYAHLRDQPTVFLADHEPTYQFIEKMLRAATGQLRSRRVFIGTDEAHGLGAGRYRRLKGLKPPFNIFNDHLRRVVDICNRIGLKPSCSGDMYFRLGSKDNWYYDEKAVIPPDIIAGIPRELQLIYWDYYHTEPAFYENWIDRHRAMGKEPLLHGAVWTWDHFWSHLPYSFLATEALMAAARKKNVRENICTLWGDDSMQVDLCSALPGLAHYAELSYNIDADPKALRAHFAGATGEDCFDDYVRASDIDLLNHRSDMDRIPDNPSTWLLWNDPMIALLDPQVTNRNLAAHHRKLATTLDKAAAKPGPLSRHLRFPAQVARVLALKIDLHRNLAAALRKNDRRAIRTILKNHLTPLRREVNRLWKIHRDLWVATYRPFGLEVLEHRYGGLRARLETLSDRLHDYLAGKTSSLPEFETRLLKVFPKEDIYGLIRHSRAFTASAHK